MNIYDNEVINPSPVQTPVEATFSLFGEEEKNSVPIGFRVTPIRPTNFIDSEETKPMLSRKNVMEGQN